MSTVTPSTAEAKQLLSFRRAKNFSRRINLNWTGVLLNVFGLFGIRRDTGIGRIIELDERKNRVALEVPATGRQIRVKYDIEFHNFLHNHLGELVEIHGNIVTDKNENPFFIDYAFKFNLVDITDVRLSDVVPSYLQLKNFKDVYINVNLSENKQYYYANYEFLEIITGAFSRSELENELRIYIDILWTDFAKESDRNLALSAVNLKRKLLSTFEEKSK